MLTPLYQLFMSGKTAQFIPNAARQQCFPAAPIDCLPNEILIQIFHSFDLPRDPDDVPEYQLTNAILVSGICRRWRELAVQTGSLWTTIPFAFQKPRARPGHAGDENHHGLSRADAFLNIARLCVQRSRDRGLNIIVGDIRHLLVKPFMAATDLILSAFSRWEVLEINGWACREVQIRHVLSEFLNSCRTNPSQSLRLHSLRLFCSGADMAPLKDILLAVLDIAPIRSLVLGSFKPTILPAHVIQSLTHLTLEHCNYEWNITPMDIDTVLRHCTQLQSLKIDRVGIRNDFLS
ncbi:hypothetical protein BOTBODRAFT_186684 [Botryobasidium botryosum FD-172 SS1]|uniref:F-box domain-containing protein n=1 Tax=Botryobasidium botryosum (strain FD-172 SS1) TaxID=930990 RepID=A0A067MNS9_BOTB1|nr:hypothetical protein BOTBODRAFT_186684 [Botryobasidium botryosum FD-172 SS1]